MLCLHAAVQARLKPLWDSLPGQPESRPHSTAAPGIVYSLTMNVTALGPHVHGGLLDLFFLSD